MSSSSEKESQVEFPPECFLLNRVPHEWLLSRIDVASDIGTIGTSLMAG